MWTRWHWRQTWPDFSRSSHRWGCPKSTLETRWRNDKAVGLVPLSLHIHRRSQIRQPLRCLHRKRLATLEEQNMWNLRLLECRCSRPAGSSDRNTMDWKLQFAFVVVQFDCRPTRIMCRMSNIRARPEASVWTLQARDWSEKLAIRKSDKNFTKAVAYFQNGNVVHPALLAVESRMGVNSRWPSDFY